MNAVVTLCVGDGYEKIAKLTHPTLKAYADRIGAEFVIISERTLPDAPVGYEKFQCKELLDKYERIIFLDTDLIVRDDCPNLFQFVPEGWFGAFDEGGFIKRKVALENASQTFQLAIKEPLKWGSRYYNTGVMVFDRTHKDIFTLPPICHNHFYEQSYLNLQISRNCKIDLIKNLSPQFNRMSHIDGECKEDRLEFYITHYAGTMSGAGFSHLIPPGKNVCDLIDADLQELDRRKSTPSGYHVPKKIKVSVGGGLGDQVDAEPVVREIRRLYPHDHLIVASHWPEIFEGLDYKIDEVVDISKHLNPPDLYVVFHTYAGPDTDAGKYLTHVLMHSVDFSSLHTIRRQLPPEKKQITIKYTKAERFSMLRKIGMSCRSLKSAIVIHPGRSWRTKTIAAETWNKAIEKISKKRKVILIGKDEYSGPKRGADRIGLVEVEVPEGVVDARNKLTVKETLALLDSAHALVSNDSAPVHLAGATNIWIVGIFTAKHPNFVLPFRHGSQFHKTIECNKRPSCWPCNANAVHTFPSEVRADHCLNYEKPLTCHPTAGDIVEAVEKTFSAKKRWRRRHRHYSSQAARLPN